MSLMEIFADYGLKTLKQWAIQRQLPLLFERSLRLQNQLYEDSRALISFPVEALPANSLNEVLQICQAMSSPMSHRSAIERFLPQAGFVHFGFERTGETLIGKCYLELPPQSAVSTKHSGRTKQLTFIGYKWSMNNESTAVVSRYESTAVNSWEALCQPVIASVPNAWLESIQQLLAVFRPERDSTDISDYRLLSVTEEGSQRQSWDLNVYCRNVKRTKLVPQLTAFCEPLLLDSSVLESWNTKQPKSIIGHIAAGTTRTKQPFITIYHSADINSM